LIRGGFGRRRGVSCQLEIASLAAGQPRVVYAGRQLKHDPLAGRKRQFEIAADLSNEVFVQLSVARYG